MRAPGSPTDCSTAALRCCWPETLGGSAGNLCATQGRVCVGGEINANHLRAVREGIVTGTARPLHVGGRIQVWEIRIKDDQGRLACISRLTLAVVTQP